MDATRSNQHPPTAKPSKMTAHRGNVSHLGIPQCGHRFRQCRFRMLANAQPSITCASQTPIMATRKAYLSMLDFLASYRVSRVLGRESLHDRNRVLRYVRIRCSELLNPFLVLWFPHARETKSTLSQGNRTKVSCSM